MERESTMFLRIVVLATGVGILALCSTVLIPAIFKEDDMEFLVILLCMNAAAIPFFIALYQTLKLLSFVDRSTAFSESSIRALKNIKYCGIAVSVLYAVAMPFIYIAAQKDDAPGLILIGSVFVVAPVAVAVFAAILQKLLRNAIDMKSENELTV